MARTWNSGIIQASIRQPSQHTTYQCTYAYDDKRCPRKFSSFVNQTNWIICTIRKHVFVKYTLSSLHIAVRIQTLR